MRLIFSTLKEWQSFPEMNTGLSLRYCYCTILQVVAIVVGHRGKVSSEVVQGCVGSRLSLRCPEMKVIQILAVVLGDSGCLGTTCCIKNNDCTRHANVNHRSDVNSRCNGQVSCTVDVFKEEIDCGFFYDKWSNNDFERITYDCRADPRRTTISVLASSDAKETNLYTKEYTTENERTTVTDDTLNSTAEKKPRVNKYDFNNESDGRNDGEKSKMTDNSAALMPAVMATVCFVVLIAIVVVAVIIRRKKWPKFIVPIEMRDIDSSNQNEAIYENVSLQPTNENQPTTSLPNGSGPPIYSNIKIKKSRDKGAKASETREESNCVVQPHADRRPTDDPNVCCGSKGGEPVYLIPRPRSAVYSLARDVGEREGAGSTASASHIYSNVDFGVVTREPATAHHTSAQDAYDDDCRWKESENKSSPAERAKKTSDPSHKTISDLYTKVNKPSKNAAAIDSKRDSHEKTEAKDGASTSDGLPNPIYETMSPEIPAERIYANAAALLSPDGGNPLASTTVQNIPKMAGPSEAENQYCDMRPPSQRLKDNKS